MLIQPRNHDRIPALSGSASRAPLILLFALAFVLLNSAMAATLTPASLTAVVDPWFSVGCSFSLQEDGPAVFLLHALPRPGEERRVAVLGLEGQAIEWELVNESWLDDTLLLTQAELRLRLHIGEESGRLEQGEAAASENHATLEIHRGEQGFEVEGLWRCGC